MKILHVFNQPRSRGGSLAATRALIDITRRKGHEVEVFSTDSTDLPNGLRGKVAAAISAFHSPGSVRAFSEALDRFKPDLVHANELFPLISPKVLAICNERGIPVVMTCDDYHLTCPTRNHFRAGDICTKCIDGHEHWAILHNCKQNMPESIVNSLYSANLRHKGLFPSSVDHFITCSEFTKAWLVEHANLAPERVTAIPHPVEIPETETDPTIGSYAAFAGRFVPEKGIDTLLEAASACEVPVKLSRNHRHFDTIDLPPDVDVVVTTGRDDLAEFYRGARMLVFPSRWFETQGLVGAEAMSHGIPVIGSRLGALCDLIDDGITGLLYEPGDPTDLADKLTYLWGDPELCRRLGRAAREKALEHWHPDRNFARVMDVYHSVLDTAMV